MINLYNKHSTLFNLVFIVLLIILSEAVAQSCLKQYSVDNKLHYLLLGCIFYFSVIMLLCKSYNYEGMYNVNFFWSIGSIITIMMFDIIFFHAEIKKEDIIGMALSFTGLYFIFVHGHNKKK